tara:strand:- start:463 stop:717 length:255 start_codon:yes stop_codon:yes gene_type:complete
MSTAYASQVESASLKAKIALGSLVKVGQKLGLVIRRLKYGWVVRWNNGKKEIISWNTKERKWKARERDITIIEKKDKRSERNKK